VETSVLIRYLTGDPPDQAERARRLIDEDQVLVPVIALSETAYSLGHHYGLSRADTVDLLVSLLDRVNVELLDLPTELAREGLLLCRPSNRVSFSDALIWASARARPRGPLYTFDQRFPSGGLEVRVP
jgi:predicted nucleic acid-binding protein